MLGAGLGIDALNELRGIGKAAQTEGAAIGSQAQQDTAFKPFLLVQVLVVYRLTLLVVLLLRYLQSNRLYKAS